MSASVQPKFFFECNVQQLENFKRDLEDKHYTDLQEIKRLHYKKLNSTLKTWCNHARISQEINTNILNVFVTSMISLKLICEEQNKRSFELHHRVLRSLFVRARTAAICYGTAAVGVIVSTILFGLTNFIHHIALLVCVIVAVIFTCIGGVGGIAGNLLESYYAKIHVSKDELAVQNAFAVFVIAYLSDDREKCKKVLDGLPIRLKALIKHEALLYEVIGLGNSNLGALDDPIHKSLVEMPLTLHDDSKSSSSSSNEVFATPPGFSLAENESEDSFSIRSQIKDVILQFFNLEQQDETSLEIPEERNIPEEIV